MGSQARLALRFHRGGKCLIVAGTKDLADRIMLEAKSRELFAYFPPRYIAVVGFAEDRVESYDRDLVVLERIDQLGEHQPRPRPLPKLRDTAVVDRSDRDHARGRTRSDGIDTKVVGDEVHPLECAVEAVVGGEHQTQQHDPEQEGAPRESESRE